VDWKAYARLEKLFLKVFHDEEDLSVHLLIDGSNSMSFGTPVSKWQFAQRAAAAIGFVALHENNQLDAAAFSANLSGKVAPLRGDQSIPLFLKALANLPAPSGETKFATVVRKYAETAPPAGLVLIFSDFFDPDIASGLASLAAQRHQVGLVQILDRSEVEPDFEGDFSLVDSETGLMHEVTLTRYEIDQYRNRLQSFTAELMATARRGFGRLGAPLPKIRRNSCISQPTHVGWASPPVNRTLQGDNLIP
jgi:uncharacterized protein (DUF58 family)